MLIHGSCTKEDVWSHKLVSFSFLFSFTSKPFQMFFFFFFLPAVSLLVFALSVPSLLIQTGPIILSVPAESIGRGMSRLFRKSLPHPRQSDHSHTLFQTMKLKYPLEENSKIKKMKSFEQKLHFLFFILQLGNKKKKKFSQLFCCESVRKYLWLQRLSGQPECVSVFVYNCVYVEGRRETGDGASAAGASWFCPALPCTL